MRRPALTAIASVPALLATHGCAVHTPGYDEPLTPPASFLDDASSGAFSASTPDGWWRAFEDPELDTLQARALGANFDLATFRDRLDAARAATVRDRSPLFPSIDYSVLAEQTRRDANSFQGEDRFGASLIGSYEFDLWRRNANIAGTATLREAIAGEQLVAAAISLSADVALTWYALIEQRGQLRVLDEQIETNRDVLRVVELRFASGVVRASDVLRQERLLESTFEQRAIVVGNIEVLEHALLVLVGRSPTEDLADARDRLPDVPTRPLLGLPSELLERRPDIRSAMLAIREADAEVGVAVADRYPSVRLRFEASTREDAVADVFDNWATLVRVDVLGPLFDAGARSAEVDRTLAVKSERINAYAQSVLTAFEQVLNAVTRENASEEQIARIETQLVLAQRTSERLNREYLNGDISYIDVLDALTTEQRLQRDLLSARFDRISERINLDRALAGGWDGIVPGEPIASASTRTDEPETGTQ
ncbi:MAG: TolC family protein [Planctomycetota bacterium]